MPTFTYTARDAKGQIKNATIEAASRDDVVAQLRRQRMNVVKINEETKKGKVGSISMRDIVVAGPRPAPSPRSRRPRRRNHSAFEPAPTLDQGEGRAPSARLGQLGLGLAA